MARKSWRCPHCGTKWSIPANAPDPENCPKCPEVGEQRVRFAAIHELPEPVVTDRERPMMPYWPHARRLGVVTLICFIPIVLAILCKPIFDEQWREDARWTPMLHYDTGRSLRQTIYLALLAFASMAPVWIVWMRQHPYRIPISVLSIFGSWTCIGWIVAMVWSVMPIKSENP